MLFDVNFCNLWWEINVCMLVHVGFCLFDLVCFGLLRKVRRLDDCKSLKYKSEQVARHTSSPPSLIGQLTSKCTVLAKKKTLNFQPVKQLKI